MVSVKGVTKRFGGRTAVDNVSFTVSKGRILGLLGPNGAGKTTTMRIITGFLAPTEGSVEVDGVDLFEHPSDVKAKIGYMPEQPPLYSEFTVREFLSFIGEIKGIEKNKLHGSIVKTAELCGLSDVLDRIIGNLSKGYRQRVGLAQALIHDPEVLILDEPTVGLDPRQIVEIRKLIRSLAGKRTVILSTHILSEVKSICHDIAVINNGRILAFDEIERLSERLKGGTRIVVRTARPDKLDIEEIKRVSGIASAELMDDGTLEIISAKGTEPREEISGLIVSSGAGLLEMSTVNLSVEDLYLKIILGEGGGNA